MDPKNPGFSVASRGGVETCRPGLARPRRARQGRAARRATDAWAWEAKWDACRLLGQPRDAADAEAKAMAAATANGPPGQAASMRDSIAMAKRTPQSPREARGANPNPNPSNSALMSRSARIELNHALLRACARRIPEHAGG